jgi:S-adenosylhomocysteine hydrolase
MKKETLQQANEIFKRYDINTFIKDNTIFINLGNIELELSKEEIKARAKQYINLNNKIEDEN